MVNEKDGAVIERQGLETFTLKAGEVVTRNGVPAYLTKDTEIQTHPNNWPLMHASHAIGDPNLPITGPADSSKR